jgi:hypothetical protein
MEDIQCYLQRRYRTQLNVRLDGLKKKTTLKARLGNITYLTIYPYKRVFRSSKSHGILMRITRERGLYEGTPTGILLNQS